MMAPRRTFRAIAAFLSGEGASRRVLLGRGVLFVLVPLVIPVVLALAQNRGAQLVPLLLSAGASPVSRTSEIVDDWMMIAYGGIGIFCEILGLAFLGKVKKKFDLTTALSLLAESLAVFLIVILFNIGVVGAVDLIRPGARIWS
jgi:hypothetical protein